MLLATVLNFRKKRMFKAAFSLLGSFLALAASAQENSPYSRYGLGDQVPNTSILSRGMGGISAGIWDITTVNFANPASYAKFQTILEERSRQLSSGRVVLDVGLNFDNRTIRTPNTTERFSSNNGYFSYVQVGLPLRRNWGLSFGLRPVTRIDYRILRREQLKDPITNNNIDSALTEFTGSGGSFLPTIGTGFSIGRLSVGGNVGYLFGRREVSTRRALFAPNDSAAYASSNHATNTSFGDLFFNAGLQYSIPVGATTELRLGAAGNWSQTLSASQDRIRETFIRSATNADIQIDSVEEITGQSGEIVYPASYTVGFALNREPGNGTKGYTLGVDLVQSQWSDYRFFGASDLVRNNWQVRVGGQLSPGTQPKSVYSQAITYRAGIFMGQDYIRAGGDLPVYGVSVGMGLPLFNYNRLSPGQFTLINLALEYGRRGNNENVVKENTFRVSVGLNLTDLWFGKRRYE